MPLSTRYVVIWVDKACGWIDAENGTVAAYRVERGNGSRTKSGMTAECDVTVIEPNGLPWPNGRRRPCVALAAASEHPAGSAKRPVRHKKPYRNNFPTTFAV